MTIKDSTIQKFLDNLASAAPTPGGGSAAAIMGATGAALVAMVCNLTIGKKNYAAVESDMRRILGEAETLRQKLTGMIEADVDAFDQVMAGYGMPKDNDAQKTARSEAIQAALKNAATVCLACAQTCADVVALTRETAEKGNLNVVSDAGVAVLAAHAGLKSAALNVYINANSVKDKAFADSKLAELEAILKKSGAESDQVYELVKGKL